MHLTWSIIWTHLLMYSTIYYIKNKNNQTKKLKAEKITHSPPLCHYQTGPAQRKEQAEAESFQKLENRPSCVAPDPHFQQQLVCWTTCAKSSSYPGNLANCSAILKACRNCLLQKVLLSLCLIPSLPWWLTSALVPLLSHGLPQRSGDSQYHITLRLSSHFEDICLCYWLQDGERKQAQKYCKGERGEGGETNSHSIMHQSLYGAWRCHTAIANKLVLLIWWARIWFPLCLCEPTQLSWQAGEREPHQAKSWLCSLLFWNQKEGGAENC